MPRLGLDLADRIADAAIEQAAALSPGRPVTVAILDAGGHVIVLKRQDGSGFMKPDVAVAKAWGGLGMERSSRALGERAAEDPSFVGALATLSGGRLLPVAGGVRILDGTAPVGAVGVTGMTSDLDEEAAITAIASVGFGSDPEAPQPR